MIDRSKLAIDTGEYEKERAQNRLNVTQMFFVFVKGTIGLAIFGFHEIFLKSGYILGTIVSVVFMYLVTHGCMRLVTYAEEVEAQEEFKGYHVDSYFELCELMFPAGSKIGKFLGPFVFSLTFVSSACYMLSSVIAFSDTISSQLGFHPLVGRLFVFGTTCVALILMVQPEKMLYLSYFTVTLVFILLLSSMGFGFFKIFKDGEDWDHVQTFSIKDLSISMGYAITSLEVINYILNLRRLMAKQSLYTKVGYGSLFFCGSLYVLPGLLIYLAYSNEVKDKQLYYQLFLTHWPVKVLNVLMNINFLYGCYVFSTFNMEMLEKVKGVKDLLRDENNNLRTINVLIGRVVFLAVVVVVSIWITDLRLVYAVTGIFMNSFIGMIVPGFLGILRPREYRAKDRFSETIGDWLCVILGLTAILWYFLDLIK